VNIANDDRKKAALLHHAGVHIAKIYKTIQQNPLPNPAAVESAENVRPVDQFADVKRKLTAYFNPKRNIYYEVHKFRKANQLKGESLDNYATRLRQLSLYCEFNDVDKEIISQIIENSIDTEIAKKALRSGDELKLESLLEWCRVRAITSSQVSYIKNENNECKCRLR